MPLPIHYSARKVLQIVAVLWLAVPVSGCQTPLRDYPAELPKLVVLSADCSELNGTYGNQGSFTTPSGDTKFITLTSLVPAQPHGYGPLQTVSSRFADTHTVSVRVRNPSKESGLSDKPWGESRRAYESFRKLEFSSDVEHGAETVTVDGYSLQRTDVPDGGYVIEYVRAQHGGSLGVVGGGKTSAVWLTKSADGSLVAGIEDISYSLVVVVPVYTRLKTWARFPRIGD